MAPRQITDSAVERYAAAHSSAGPAYLAAVAADTERAFPSLSRMLTGHLEGRFLKALAAMLGARRILEIGTFTGYSALCLAEGMVPEGQLITCELDPHHAAVARANIAASPHATRIEVREGPALETIKSLEGPFDLIFIDADKESYPAYYEAALGLLGSEGAIAIDNTLRGGQVLSPDAEDPGTLAIASLNDHIAGDPRVEGVLLPIRDGLTLVRRRQSLS